MKTVCSLISPVLAFMNRARTKIGRRVGHVLLLALLHRELRRRAQVGVRRGRTRARGSSCPVKSSIGLMSREGLGQALLEEPLERVALDGDRGRAAAGPRRGWRRRNAPGYWTVQATAYSSQSGWWAVTGDGRIEVRTTGTTRDAGTTARTQTRRRDRTGAESAAGRMSAGARRHSAGRESTVTRSRGTATAQHTAARHAGRHPGVLPTTGYGRPPRSSPGRTPAAPHLGAATSARRWRRPPRARPSPCRRPPWRPSRAPAWGAVDEVLGLLEAQAGERADLLDDLDLLVAGGGEDDVELALLLLGRRRRRRRPPAPRRPPRRVPRRSRRSAPRTPSAAR